MARSIVSPTNGKKYPIKKVERKSSKRHVTTLQEERNMWLFFNEYHMDWCDRCGWSYNINLLGETRLCADCIAEGINKHEISSCSQCKQVLQTKDMHAYNGYWYCDECYEALYVPCAICGKRHLKDTSRKLANEQDAYICEDCVGTMVKCNACGGYHNETEYGGYCRKCFERTYFKCIHCGKVFKKSSAIGIKNHLYCDECASKLFNRCQGCGRYSTEPLVESYCPDCIDRYTWKGKPKLYDYHGRDCVWNFHDEPVKKKITFKPKDGVRYLGFELELNGTDSPKKEREDLIFESHDILHEIVHYERDNSLISPGFEVVSEPMTLSAHMSYAETYCEYFKWIEQNKKSLHHDGAGLHIHVTATTFNRIKIRRLLYIFLKYQAEMRVIARRNSSSYASYPDLSTIENHANLKWNKDNYDNTVLILKAFESYIDGTPGSGNSNHSIFLNIGGTSSRRSGRHSQTSEFRLWKSASTYLEFMGTLQLTDHLCEIIQKKTLKDLMNMNFSQIVWTEYPELNKYLLELGVLKRNQLNEAVLNDTELHTP